MTNGQRRAQQHRAKKRPMVRPRGTAGYPFTAILKDSFPHYCIEYGFGGAIRVGAGQDARPTHQFIRTTRWTLF